MKILFVGVLALVWLVGCAAFKKDTSLPQARETAADAYVESAYESYFGGQNFYERMVRLEGLTARLHTLMPEKGHPKKMLIAQFLSDVQREKDHFAGDNSNSGSRSHAWVPPPQVPDYSAKIRALGRVAASYRIMVRMGIYLTASGVFEKDSGDEDFYLSLLDRATADIESGLRGLTLVYKPEDREADEAAASLAYAGALTVRVRQALPRAYPARGAAYRRLDGFFRRLAAAPDAGTMRSLLGGSDGRYAGRILKELHVMNSGDIEGFEDEVDITISTKFGFEMIQHLLAARGRGEP